MKFLHARPRSLRHLLPTLLAFTCCHASPQVKQEREFRSGFGIVTKFAQGQPRQQMALLPMLGVRWVRDAVMWEEMEPTAGDYRPFPKEFEARLDRYKSMGIGVVYFLAYANNKAYPRSAENPLASVNPKAFGRYAAHVTRLLKQSGVNFVIEAWNEPHNYQIKEWAGGTWNGTPPSPWVDHYVEMVREASQQVKNIDANIMVLDSEDVWVNHYRFFETKRLPKGFNGIGLHPYTNASSSGPEVVAATPDSEWAKPYQLVDTDRSFSSALNRMRRHAQQFGAQDPQVWITEWGWKLGDKYAHGQIDEGTVAAFLPRAYITAEAAGSKVLCWFSMYDSVDGPWGLVDNQGRARPAFRAYATMNRILGSLHYVRRLSADNKQTIGVQAHEFAGSDERVIATWSADTTSHAIKLDPKWGDVEIHDALGAEVTPTVAESGSSLVVTGLPVYIKVKSTTIIKWP